MRASVSPRSCGGAESVRLAVGALTGASRRCLSFDGRRYRWSGGPLDLVTCKRALATVPGMKRPVLLRDLVDSGALVLEPGVAAVVTLAWAEAVFPEDAVQRGRWLEWFGAVGFTTEHGTAERPVEPVALYRGCMRGAVRRMAWSARPGVAWMFAHTRMAGRLPGDVWAARVRPEHLLAYLRPGSEYVVDPSGLTDVRCTGW